MRKMWTYAVAASLPFLLFLSVRILVFSLYPAENDGYVGYSAGFAAGIWTVIFTEQWVKMLNSWKNK